MDVLKDMFPQHSEEILAVVLEDNRGDIEAALAVILSPEFEPRGRDPPPQPVPEVPNLPSLPTFQDLWKKSEVRSISTSLEALIGQEKDADVELHCTDGSIVFAHQLILSARCEYLQILLSSVEPEPGHNRRVLDLDMPKPVLLHVLAYLYSDRVNVRDEEKPALHEACTYLDLVHLRRVCEDGDVGPSKYPSDMLSLLDEDKQHMADVELEAENRVFHAHKLILSCGSEYFKEMFAAKFLESGLHRVPIPNVSANDLELILQCIYTDGHVRRDAIDVDNAFPMFLMANSFLVPSLQAFTEEFMVKHLDEENAIVLLSDAARLSAALRRHCLEYIAKNYEKTIETEGYKALPTVLLMEIEQFAAKRNEDALTTMIGMISEVEVHDFQTLVQEEILSFLDYELGDIRVEDIVEHSTESFFGPCDFTLSNIRLSPPEPELRGAKKEEEAKPVHEKRKRKPARRIWQRPMPRDNFAAPYQYPPLRQRRAALGEDSSDDESSSEEEPRAAVQRRLDEAQNLLQRLLQAHRDALNHAAAPGLNQAPARPPAPPHPQASSSEEESSEDADESSSDEEKPRARPGARRNSQDAMPPAPSRASAQPATHELSLESDKSSIEEEKPSPVRKNSRGATPAPSAPPQEPNYLAHIAVAKSDTTSSSDDETEDDEDQVKLDAAAEPKNVTAPPNRLPYRRPLSASSSSSSSDEAAAPQPQEVRARRVPVRDETSSSSEEEEVSEEEATSSESGSSSSSSTSTHSSSSALSGLHYFNKNAISVLFTARTLNIVASDIMIAVKGLRWSYVQHNEWRQSEHGLADVLLRGVRFSLTFRITLEFDIPRLELEQFVADIDDFAFTFADPKKGHLHAFVPEFGTALKTAIVQAAQAKLTTSLTRFTNQLSRLGPMQI